MCKFESSQKDESRWQSTDSSKAYRNTSAFKKRDKCHLFLQLIQMQNLKRKMWGGHSILCHPSEKVRGTRSPCLHLIVPMGMPIYTSIIKFYAVCYWIRDRQRYSKTSYISAPTKSTLCCSLSHVQL